VPPEERPDSIFPVPKGEGPGAPSAWFGTIIGTGATSQGLKPVHYVGLFGTTEVVP